MIFRRKRQQAAQEKLEEARRSLVEASQQHGEQKALRQHEQVALVDKLERRATDGRNHLAAEFLDVLMRRSGEPGHESS